MKQIIFFIAFIFCFHSSYSQGFFVKLNGGYGIPLFGQTIEIPILNNYSYAFNTKLTNSFTDERGGIGISYNKVNPITFGQGINFGGSVGYYIKKNWGVDLAFSYLISDKFKAKQDWELHLDSKYYDYFTVYSRMLRINPGVFVTTEIKKFNPYFKLGMLLGKGDIIINEEAAQRSDITLQDSKLYGGLAIGYNLAIGTKYKLSKRLSVFCEAAFINMKYSPTKGKLTKLYYHGQDWLSSLSTSEKEIVLKKNVDPNSYLDENKPKEFLKINYPFNSLETNIGLIYSFK